MTHVLVNGAKGNMGKAAVAAINADSALNLVSELDKDDNLADHLNHDSNIDVVVDLTHPSCVFDNVHTILSHGCHAVVGTTGLTEDQLRDLNDLGTTQKKAVIVCPNFAIGAILMMRFAQEAAKLMDRCEIIEYHHDKKADAPSGTAIKTAELIAESNNKINTPGLTETELISGSRGGNKHNIPIHAVRIPGIVANQEVIFGTQGQSLTLRHDTISREAFMPGLLLAVKATANHTGLVYGLEHLL
jgi:4-hydroxy-tetrahydrodipicolinate reductase